jgi:hypothetical protein
LKEFIPYLEKIWNSKWITNNGHFHQELENALCEYLGVKYISVFTNGTLPLITALQALRITGEVITTPYSFVATSHAIWWNGLQPVFVDVDPVTGNIDPDKIEAAITPRTTAIMPVHVYGNPCDTEKIDALAKKYNLKVIYDAAHAFGVKVNGKSILEAGDISTLSFHATKTYNTIEGGALVCHSAEMKQQIDYLKNFGFEDETVVVAPGINGKMDEVDFDEADPLINRFLLEYHMNYLRPRIIVDYDRTAYVDENIDARVTFDSNIGFSDNIIDFFDPDLSLQPIMPLGKELLEVKYTEVLPEYIHQILNLKNIQQSTFSKYYLCEKFRRQGDIVL